MTAQEYEQLPALRYTLRMNACDTLRVPCYATRPLPEHIRCNLVPWQSPEMIQALVMAFGSLVWINALPSEITNW